MTAADPCLWRCIARQAHFAGASPLWRVIQPDGGDLRIALGPLDPIVEQLQRALQFLPVLVDHRGFQVGAIQ